MPNPPPKPIFGIEIEIFVKVKRDVQRDVERYRGSLPLHWREWDFNLSNRSTDNYKTTKQRVCVKTALSALIKESLGSNGWKCVGDASLSEWKMREAPEPDLWWGVEIISPPMSVARRWQSEIREVFDAIGEQFELWTHPVTSCHVHVSPGPTSSTKYRPDQLVRIAKGAFFWEKALKQILPHDRRENHYAKPNYKAFGTSMYRHVKDDSWRPLFNAIDNEMDRFENHRQGQKKCFCIKIAGGHLSDPNHKYRKERYLSQNFLPYTRIGTVELRRQGGVASAQSAIHRVLLAVTLHVSARRYDFRGAASRKDHPTPKELISELAGCIKNLPRTCHGTRFVHYLNQCVERYGGNELSERAINAYEYKLHDTSGSSTMSARRPTSSARGGGGGGRGGGGGGGGGRGGGGGGGGRGGGGGGRGGGGGGRGGLNRVQTMRTNDGRVVNVVNATPAGYR
ncbi:hypothetical protein F5144DRAFT_625529 [Chaetomium tenue]|uniref:Uncharacterized protein n=1 Tax=Chaetomium tenue TaxID=1854479 RepID=A0ACB7PQH4_9PEZI|nr:hypothetical protein F5144DRAFT_625529 [Chaetomium globosum]